MKFLACQIVQYKQHCRLAEKRRKALDMHLNFIVGQTEKYSSWLVEGMSGSAALSTTTSSRSLSRTGSGSDLDGSESESDDEATIEKEEEAAPNEVRADGCLTNRYYILYSILCIVLSYFIITERML